MEPKSTSSQAARADRELATLKLISRLLAHELHAQAGQRLQLSRNEVSEIQTAIDQFIERASNTRTNTTLTSVETGSTPSNRTAPSNRTGQSAATSPVEARMN